MARKTAKSFAKRLKMALLEADLGGLARYALDENQLRRLSKKVNILPVSTELFNDLSFQRLV